MEDKFHIANATENYFAYMRESFRIGSKVEGAGVKLGRVRVGVKVSGNLVVDSKEVLDVGKSTQVLTECLQGAIKFSIGNIVTELGALYRFTISVNQANTTFYECT